MIRKSEIINPYELKLSDILSKQTKTEGKLTVGPILQQCQWIE